MSSGKTSGTLCTPSSENPTLPYARIWPIASPCREEICVRGGYGTPTDSYGIQLITSFNHLFVTAIQLNLGQYNSDG